MSQTQQRSICSRISDRRVSEFGHVRRLQESVPVHEALRLAVKTRSGHRSDDRPEWKHPRGRPRQTWIRRLETDVGYSGTPLMLFGTWPVIVNSGGRNDPSQSSGPVSE